MNDEEIFYDELTNVIKTIDTEKLNLHEDNVDQTPITKIIDEQKVYFWGRLFIDEDEDTKLEKGDTIIIKWEPTGEELETKFISFGKKGLEKDNDNQVTYWDKEEDDRILTLMIDEKQVNHNPHIPFIRTLFKTSHHYEYQLVKRSELVFIHQRTNKKLKYYDSDL